jgi:hypothetical protein
MSISIGHRSIFTAFGHRTSFKPRAAALSLTKEVEAPAAVVSGELTCSPWEGLYLEQARPVVKEEDTATTSRQLDAFLASLMYGE